MQVMETIRNGVDTEQLFGTLDAVKAQPELAAFTWRVRNEWIARRAQPLDDPRLLRRRPGGHLARRRRSPPTPASPRSSAARTPARTRPSTCCTRSPPASRRRSSTSPPRARCRSPASSPRSRATWTSAARSAWTTTSPTASRTSASRSPSRATPRREAARGRPPRHGALRRLRHADDAACPCTSTSSRPDRHSAPGRDAPSRPGHPPHRRPQMSIPAERPDAVRRRSRRARRAASPASSPSPRPSTTATRSYPFEGIAALQRARYFTAPVPCELGGLGVESLHDLVVASSRLARGDASVAIGVNMHMAVLGNVVRRWRRPRRSGDLRRASAFGETLTEVVHDGAVIADRRRASPARTSRGPPRRRHAPSRAGASTGRRSSARCRRRRPCCSRRSSFVDRRRRGALRLRADPGARARRRDPRRLGRARHARLRQPLGDVRRRRAARVRAARRLPGGSDDGLPGVEPQRRAVPRGGVAGHRGVRARDRDAAARRPRARRPRRGCSWRRRRSPSAPRGRACRARRLLAEEHLDAGEPSAARGGLRGGPGARRRSSTRRRCGSSTASLALDGRRRVPRSAPDLARCTATCAPARSCTRSARTARTSSSARSRSGTCRPCTESAHVHALRSSRCARRDPGPAPRASTTARGARSPAAGCRRCSRGSRSTPGAPCPPARWPTPCGTATRRATSSTRCSRSSRACAARSAIRRSSSQEAAGYRLAVRAGRRRRACASSGSRARAPPRCARVIAAGAARLLTEALDLWRGAPAADALRLHDLRLAARIDRLTAARRAGRGGRARRGARPSWPTSTRSTSASARCACARWRQSGRQADALAAYEALRTALDDELGADAVGGAAGGAPRGAARRGRGRAPRRAPAREPPGGADELRRPRGGPRARRRSCSRAIGS